MCNASRAESENALYGAGEGVDEISQILTKSISTMSNIFQCRFLANQLNTPLTCHAFPMQRSCFAAWTR